MGVLGMEKNRYLGCLIGLAKGDALETTLEFKTRRASGPSNEIRTAPIKGYFRNYV
jgi:ADP-ribosylglycohydrolase